MSAPADPAEPTHDEPSRDAPADLLDVGAFIRSQRERAKMSVRKLAELAEVSNPYLSQIERGLRKPSAEILQQVANALRISVETLYVRAGILPDEARSVGTVRACRSSCRSSSKCTCCRRASAPARRAKASSRRWLASPKTPKR